MESHKIEQQYLGNSKEEDKLKVDTTTAENLTEVMGNRAIPIEDLESSQEIKELPFTAEDQDIHHAAAMIFVEGHTALRQKIKDGIITPTQSLAEEQRLREEYK